jgi:hypothetical protein
MKIKNGSNDFLMALFLLSFLSLFRKDEDEGRIRLHGFYPK